MKIRLLPKSFESSTVQFFYSQFLKSAATHALIIPVNNIVIDTFYSISVSLDKTYLRSYLFFLKYHVLCQYDLLTDLTGVSNLNQEDKPYDVIYELLSLRFNNRLRVKVQAVNNSVFTISDIYLSANWSECELWDMYGIYPENHDRLTRLLTDYGFEGHPLRKDFPLSGYYDVRYNEFKKRVIIDKLELGQEYRIFDYKVSYDNRLLLKI
jgi:NADH:ubiquinone oxidoreductase subunit C